MNHYLHRLLLSKRDLAWLLESSVLTQSGHPLSIFDHFEFVITVETMTIHVNLES